MSSSKFSIRSLWIFAQTILILTFIFPILILIILPIFLFRTIVSKWSELFVKSHGNILSPLSTVFALDDFAGQPASTILLSLTLKGQPELKQVLKRFLSILESGDYPELQQNLSLWMGFYFWKWSKGFNLENHIDFRTEPLTDAEIRNLTANLLKKPYEKDRPLWSITIVRKADSSFMNSESSVCILRFHHSLVDGNSLCKLTAQLTEEESYKQPKAKFPSRTLWANILFLLKLIFYGPFELVSTILEDQDDNDWRLSTLKGDSCKKQNSVQFKGVPLADLKLIGKAHKVTTTSVIVNLLTGAIRQMMMKYCKPENMPDSVGILCAWPMKNPPERKLTNYTTVSPIRVPILQPDQSQRLLHIQAELTRLKYSTLPYGFFALSYITGSIFPWLIRRLNTGSLGTVVFSNFPAPQDAVIEIFNKGIQVTELIVDVGVPRGFPMGFVTVGFNGLLAISNGSDRKLFPSEEMAQEFMGFVLKEFNDLQACSNV